MARDGDGAVDCRRVLDREVIEGPGQAYNLHIVYYPAFFLCNHPIGVLCGNSSAYEIVGRKQSCSILKWSLE